MLQLIFVFICLFGIAKYAATTGFTFLAPEMFRIIRQRVYEGTPPKDVVDCVFEAIKEEKFYILTHPEWKDLVRTRMEDILEDRAPTSA